MPRSLAAWPRSAQTRDPDFGCSCKPGADRRRRGVVPLRGGMTHDEDSWEQIRSRPCWQQHRGYGLPGGARSAQRQDQAIVTETVRQVWLWGGSGDSDAVSRPVDRGRDLVRWSCAF